MAWLQLTNEAHDPLLIDSEKILQIKGHAKGAHMTFTTVLPNAEGRLAPKGLVVRETVQQIAQSLKALPVHR